MQSMETTNIHLPTSGKVCCCPFANAHVVIISCKRFQCFAANAVMPFSHGDPYPNSRESEETRRNLITYSNLAAIPA